MALNVQVTDVPQQSRFEARDGDELLGYAEYIKTEELMVFTHTVVLPQFEGQGVASQLVRYALDQVRTDGTRSVMPQCSYVRGWIAKHPDYIPLVYGESKPTAD